MRENLTFAGNRNTIPVRYVSFIYVLFGEVTSGLVCMILCKISEKLIDEAVEESGHGLIGAPFPELLRGTEKNYEFP